MGYGIMPYSIKLGKISECYGELDERNQDQLLEELADDLNDLDENEDEDEEWVPAKEILQDFLEGEITETDEGHKHWYIIELLIREFGEFLPNDKWSPCGVAFTEKFTQYNEFRLYTLDSDDTIPLPLPDDFPGVWTIFNADLDIALHHIKNDYEDEAAEQFADWINTAKDRGEDLVLFLY